MSDATMRVPGASGELCDDAGGFWWAMRRAGPLVIARTKPREVDGASSVTDGMACDKSS